MKIEYNLVIEITRKSFGLHKRFFTEDSRMYLISRRAGVNTLLDESVL